LAGPVTVARGAEPLVARGDLQGHVGDVE